MRIYAIYIWEYLYIPLFPPFSLCMYIFLWASPCCYCCYCLLLLLLLFATFVFPAFLLLAWHSWSLMFHLCSLDTKACWLPSPGMGFPAKDLEANQPLYFWSLTNNRVWGARLLLFTLSSPLPFPPPLCHCACTVACVSHLHNPYTDTDRDRDRDRDKQRYRLTQTYTHKHTHVFMYIWLRIRAAQKYVYVYLCI